VLASFIPIRGSDQSVAGVFELHQNVTPFIDELERDLWWMTAGVVLTFAALYVMQFLVVRRAQGILEDQEGRLKAARDTLELQVEARTEELKRTNSQLESEIAERRQAQSKLNYLAYHDPLTGLANRRCFIERLEESLRETARRGERLAVLFIDLDQFKQVNDSLGHGIGDELLVSVATRLSDHDRLIDMLARLGGDEFICLMVGEQRTEGCRSPRPAKSSGLRAALPLGDTELFLTASSASASSRATATACWPDAQRRFGDVPCQVQRARGNYHFLYAGHDRAVQ
jgi:diguanylate cyclase (GGDEF)-like protein